AILWLDQPGEKINKISLDLLDMFEGVLDQVEHDPHIRGVVLISKKDDTFIAGADLDELMYMPEPDEARNLSRQGHILVNRVADFSKPVVAAIHGAALGGGLEIALACSYRIATDDRRTVMGLPEVKLGLLPAGGGTQRLPRLIGIQRALTMMLTGSNRYPRQAWQMGLIDDVIHQHGLLSAAVTVARRLADTPSRRKKRQPVASRLLEATPVGRKLIYKKAREVVQGRIGCNYPAPFRIIECVETGIERGISAGYEAEEKYFGELVVSPEARELINIFFAMTAMKKNPLRPVARDVKSLGILGAGLMGSGIAQVSASRGFEVFLKDIHADALGRGEKAIWDGLTGNVKKGKLSPFERDRIFSRITGTVADDGFDTADLVIEAVFEDLELKQSILTKTEAVMDVNSIFASNTSSLPISRIAEASSRPEQVIGMHYFSPVPKMPLLEIIITEKTADWVTATAIDTGIRQGKAVIVVRDGPGFYTTRILAPFLNEALTILEEGGDIREIDTAMMEFGFPVGPMALLDEVGIDVGAHVSRVLTPLFADRGAQTTDVMNALVQAGYRGRKNNRGFYRYDSLARKKKKKGVNEEIYSFFRGTRRTTIAKEDIQRRLTLMMVNEAAHCLQEEVLQSPRDGDIGAVFGLGFPPFLGGPFRYMDATGPSRILSRLKELEQKHGRRFSPAGIMEDKAAQGALFYHDKEFA
ncbi:MAG: fatty acid oxidation complex subunit alpha FadJ, partial [Deltaproteobacteria bacterium]|nr:fatty acid oxidation complex subunit alpha FadJ [Deltaproteobacteria bacterium]